LLKAVFARESLLTRLLNAENFKFGTEVVPNKSKEIILNKH